MQWEMLHIDMFVKGYCPMIWGFVYGFNGTSIVVWFRFPYDTELTDRGY